MKVLLCRSNAIGSWLIRALTWSSWSHAALVQGDEAIEATWPRVERTTVAAIRARHTECILVDLPCMSPDAAWAWAKGQVGQPYDWAALLGFILHRDWAEDRHWFCSELVAAAFEEGGSPLFRPDVLHRITPQDLWILPGSPS